MGSPLNELWIRHFRNLARENLKADGGSKFKAKNYVLLSCFRAHTKHKLFNETDWVVHSSMTKLEP